MHQVGISFMCLLPGEGNGVYALIWQARITEAVFGFIG